MRAIKFKCYFLLAEGQINQKMFSSHMARKMAVKCTGIFRSHDLAEYGLFVAIHLA